MPSLIHHTASRDNPPTAELANGGPLSVRIAQGRPYSRNAASKMARTRWVSVFSTACERSRSLVSAALVAVAVPPKLTLPVRTPMEPVSVEGSATITSAGQAM